MGFRFRGGIRQEENMCGRSVHIISSFLVVSGIFTYHNKRSSIPESLTLEETEAILREYREGNPNSMTPEEIREVLKSYAASNPDRMTREEVEALTGGRVVSQGRSGVGSVNHETGEVIVYVTETGDRK